jgi:hypothetical protein
MFRRALSAWGLTSLMQPAEPPSMALDKVQCKKIGCKGIDEFCGARADSLICWGHVSLSFKPADGEFACRRAVA